MVEYYELDFDGCSLFMLHWIVDLYADSDTTFRHEDTPATQGVFNLRYDDALIIDVVTHKDDIGWN